MFRFEKVKALSVFGLLLAFLMLVFSTSRVTGETEPFAHVQEKLDGISEEQNENLKSLFILVQEIEEIEKEEELLGKEKEVIFGEIRDLEEVLLKGEMIYEKKQGILKQILKNYQRSGFGSYLELILDSDNLTMFLRRINALRDLTQNTGELLAFLEESKAKLALERKTLAEKLLLAEDKQKQLAKSYQEKLQLIEKKEEYLKSLQQEREFYQEYLASLEQSWTELKPMFSQITKEISRIIEEGNLPADAMKISFGISGLKGTLDEETFNKIIAEHDLLPEMFFDFTPEKIEMNLPKQRLILIGTFVILEGHTLKFEAKEGSFFNMPLTAGALESLFQENDLVFNLKPMVGKSILESIEVQEGYLEFIIKPVF